MAHGHDAGVARQPLRRFRGNADRRVHRIDFTKFASRAAIERMAARRYFDVLVDTLVVRSVEPLSKSAGRRLVQHPRYYLFDVGVLNGVLRNFEVSADRVGKLSEHLVLQLIVAEAAARDEDCRVSVYRTEAGAEVDFVVERGAPIVIYRGERRLRMTNVDVLPLVDAMARLGFAQEVRAPV